jgi:hypothetical protein
MILRRTRTALLLLWPGLLMARHLPICIAIRSGWSIPSPASCSERILVRMTARACLPWPGPPMGSISPRREITSKCGAWQPVARTTPSPKMPPRSRGWPGPPMGSISPRQMLLLHHHSRFPVLVLSRYGVRNSSSPGEPGSVCLFLSAKPNAVTREGRCQSQHKE